MAANVNSIEWAESILKCEAAAPGTMKTELVNAARTIIDMDVALHAFMDVLYHAQDTEAIKAGLKRADELARKALRD